jgi:hypothetical protein
MSHPAPVSGLPFPKEKRTAIFFPRFALHLMIGACPEPEGAGSLRSGKWPGAPADRLLSLVGGTGTQKEPSACLSSSDIITKNVCPPDFPWPPLFS